MAGNSKRASMREGPLAALFRRTEEEGLHGEGRPPEQAEGSEQQAETRDPGSGIRDPEPETRREDLRPAPPSARGPEGNKRADGLHGQHEIDARVVEEPPPHVRTPEERLRTVFSSDIPENILDRPGTPTRTAPAPASAPDPLRGPVLRVVGVGGAGVNAVNRMIEAEVEGVDFIAVNTDVQSLEQSSAETIVHIGADTTRGLGSGSNPELGRQSALEDYDYLKSLLKGADMVFIAAGSGGGTGTGGAPVIARISREIGALTVGIATKPFSFEGSRRAAQAEMGIQELQEEVDTLIVIPNSRLLSVLDKSTSMVEAFRVADDVLRQGVQGISDLVTLPGLINLDFADVRTIMSKAGQALLGIGMSTGEHRALEAAQHAVASPLLETSVEGARSILLSITGGSDLSLWEVNEAAKAVSEAAHPDANIIFGAMVDEKVSDQVWVTVVATGYGDRPIRRARPSAEREGRERDESPARVADHEPRVTRVRESSLSDLHVPEFIPRG
jgi:cell division protein FtsZ